MSLTVFTAKITVFITHLKYYTNGNHFQYFVLSVAMLTYIISFNHNNNR